jgi:hypothetical protein
MYGELLSPNESPLGAPPAIKGVQAPIIAAPAGQKSADQMHFHKQRNDALAALEHAQKQHGNYMKMLTSGGDDPTPQDREASKAFETLFKIYGKIPGATDPGTMRKPQGSMWTDVDKVTPGGGIPGFGPANGGS